MSLGVPKMTELEWFNFPADDPLLEHLEKEKNDLSDEFEPWFETEMQEGTQEQETPFYENQNENADSAPDWFEYERGLSDYSHSSYARDGRDYYINSAYSEKEYEGSLNEKKQADPAEGEMDIFQFFASQNVIFLTGKLNNELAENIITLMFYIQGENEVPDQPQTINLIINSPGGSLRPAFAIYDTMKILFYPNTLAVGFVGSGASLILSGGVAGERLAFPRARIMIHQPYGKSAFGYPLDLSVQAEELFLLRKRVVMEYSINTGRDPEIIHRDLERDRFLSAKQAKEYGLVDAVLLTPDRFDSDCDPKVEPFFVAEWNSDLTISEPESELVGFHLLDPENDDNWAD